MQRSDGRHHRRRRARPPVEMTQRLLGGQGQSTSECVETI